MGHYFINDDRLKSEIKEFKITISDHDFIFKTDNGVFSKGEIDFGTDFLIKTLLKENITGRILDLGCGYGIIGITLSKLKDVDVDMIDVNKRAVHLSKLNLEVNDARNVRSFLSDGFFNIKDKYDCIVSNPPIRIGKEKLYALIKDAKNYLTKNGIIYLVIRKEQGAKSFIKDMSSLYSTTILDKSKGFYIISLK